MFKYSPKQVEFMIEAYKTKSASVIAAEFTERFGVYRSPANIQSSLYSRNVKCGRKTGRRKDTLILFNEKQVEWIKAAYKEMSCREMAEAFNERFNTDFKVSQFRSFVSNHKITSGRKGHFTKGNKSWNKGTKGLMKPNSGSFAKGNKAHNKKPVGSERITRDGFIEVKVAEPKSWELKHRIIWEAEHGKIPGGHAIRFTDSNPLNCKLDNLFIATQSENLQLNRLGYSDQPDDLKESTLLIAKIIARSCEINK